MTIKHKPHVFLDMDGVQADFCSHWSNVFDVEFKETINSVEITKLTESSHDMVYDFFRNLKPYRGGMRLVFWLKASNTPFTILSSPLRGRFREASILAKKHWLDYYNPGTSENAIFESNKYLYANTHTGPNILIDDYDKNIIEWTDAGGIAIKHHTEFCGFGSYRNTIKELKDALGYN